MTDETIKINEKDAQYLREVVGNASLMRSQLLSKMLDPRRDIDNECGYPKVIGTEQYRVMYNREGIASRVVNFMPEECWSQDPEICETEEPEESEFEKAVELLGHELHLWSYLSKGDELSGIGRFGIILLGLNDGLPLDQPVQGINEMGEKVGNAQLELLYLRPMSEDMVCISAAETDPTNPRYSLPTYYSVTFSSDETTADPGAAAQTLGKEQRVHWSRVIHLADNRESSEVYGVPRMQKVYNRLYDIRKIAGGSGEMFWKGGFPGYSFEMDPNARPLTDPQKKELKEEIAAYADGLQRYLALQGVSAKSLSPQVADPSKHIEVQLGLIALSLGAPRRIFMGSEQAQLASEQDTKRWNRRVGRRRDKYLTPFVLRPFIDRLIDFGVLPEPKEYRIKWPDVDSPSEKDQAEVLGVLVEAMAKYVGGNVDMLIPPEVFLTMFMDLEPDQVKEIMKAAMEREQEMADEEDLRREEEDQRREEEGRPPPPGSPEEEGGVP